MTVSVKTRVMIWGRSAHRCSLCRKVLEVDDGVVKNPSLVGEVAHMVAEKADGPRGSHTMSAEERDAYDNLLLLCLEHHKFVDDNPGEYPVERLIEMKRTHEKWVVESLAEFKPALQRYAETYASYIEDWSSKVRLQDWSDWTSSIMKPTPQISREFYDGLLELSDWLFKRIWPPIFPSLAEALRNFRRVLSDFLRVLAEHLDFESDGCRLRTRKFYKETGVWLEDAEYRRLAAEYEFHVDLVFDLLLELTRAANRVCDRVREHLDPAFRVKEGALIVLSIDILSSKMYRAEYDEDSQRYPGLKAFRFERKHRDHFFGKGAGPNSIEETENQFNDDNLCQLADQFENRLSAFKTADTKATEDIQRLERMLTKAGVDLEHWIDGPNDDPLDSNEIRSIGWARVNGRWRIVHHSSHYENGGSSQIPLSEMPSRTKLACVPYLVDLLKEIAHLIPDAHLDSL